MIKSIFSKSFIWVPILFLFAVFKFTTSNELTYKAYSQPYRWDAAGYYAYLPSILIYQDLEFNFHEKESGVKKEEFYRATKSGVHLNKYGMGTAMLQVPFFLIGHLQAKISDKPKNGFSEPYKRWIAIGAGFYAALGLSFLIISLNFYYPNTTSTLTVIGIGLGTNLFYYTSTELMMSHVYSFFLFSIGIWLSIKWKKSFKPIYLILLGLTIGFIGAVRLTNLVFILIPFLFGIKSLKDIRALFTNLISRPLVLILSIFLSIALLYPQFHYIFSQVGNLTSPYGKEPFFWDSPVIDKVLFSYRKGWFLWSPILLFGILGIFTSFKKDFFYPVITFFVINLYVISSWWCWWYGGSFGMRALIESSVPFAFFMAEGLNRVSSKKVGITLTFPVYSFLIYLNLFQTYQYSRGIIHHDAMTKEAYQIVFLKKAPLSKEVEAFKNNCLDFTDPKITMESLEYRKSL